MKELIKITIALAFIIGAYILGYHQANEMCLTKPNEQNHTISADKENLIQLEDSICKLNCTIDTLKNKVQIAPLPRDSSSRGMKSKIQKN